MISVLQATIDTLQGQLEVKDRQIEQQAQTITRLTDALAAAQQTAAAAQALHARGQSSSSLLPGRLERISRNRNRKKLVFKNFWWQIGNKRIFFSSLQVKKGGVIQ